MHSPFTSYFYEILSLFAAKYATLSYIRLKIYFLIFTEKNYIDLHSHIYNEVDVENVLKKWH